MIKAKPFAAAIAASLSLFAACPGVSTYFAPAVAHAEHEVPPPAVETDLGTPLPLRVNIFSEEENGQWRFRSTSINYDGPNGQDYLPLLSSLGIYNESQDEAADHERIIKSLYVHRADNLVVSFAESCAQYGGGMRGRYAVFGRNYDAATGEKLAWEDVFTNRGVVANELAILLSRNYAGESFVTGNVPDLAAKVQKIMDDGSCSWTLDPCGATFYFNMFSFSEDPYAPIYTATILFDMNAYCFQEKYRHAPEQWCMELEPRTPMRVALGVSVMNTLEVKSDVNGVHIIRGGAAAPYNGVIGKEEAVFTDSVRSNGIRPVFVKMKDGRKYLYVDTLIAPTPEDYEKGYDAQKMTELENRHELLVYDLTGDEIRRVGCDGNFTMKNEFIGDDSIPKEWFVMTDPENFKLNVTGVPLREAHRRCRVGADGAPEVVEAIQ